MANVRALLTRVAKLEAARAAPRSPIEVAYGSMDAFAEASEHLGLDPVDWPIVLQCLRRWHDEGVWEGWQRSGNRVWENGAT